MTNIIISNEKLNFFKKAFETFDTNKDGFIELNFLLDLMKSVKIQISQEESSSIINELDVEKNGKISCNEFLLFISRKYNDGVNETEDLKEAFQVLDISGNNKLIKDELRFILNNICEKMGNNIKITDEELEQMFLEANDNEKKDYISFENIEKMINKKD